MWEDRHAGAPDIAIEDLRIATDTANLFPQPHRLRGPHPLHPRRTLAQGIFKGPQQILKWNKKMRLRFSKT